MRNLFTMYCGALISYIISRFKRLERHLLSYTIRKIRADIAIIGICYGLSGTHKLLDLRK